MAKCTVVEEKPVPPPKKFLLELNQEEVNWLATLTGAAGAGRPVLLNRGIFQALDKFREFSNKTVRCFEVHGWPED